MKWFIEFTFQNVFTFFGMVILILVVAGGVADILGAFFKTKSKE